MTAIIDPRKCRLWPESHIEVLDQAAVTTGGEILAKYYSDPRHMVLSNFHVESTANLDMIVACDGNAEKLKMRANAFPSAADHFDIVKVLATRNAEVMMKMSSGSGTHVYGRWNVTTRDPTVVDKIRAEIGLTGQEMGISDALALPDRLSLNLIPQPESLLTDRVYTMFDEIYMVRRDIGILAAAADTTVGYQIVLGQGRVGTLLGVGMETTPFASVYSDSFLCVDRDADYEIMKMDCSGIPDMATLRCFVPFTDKLTVRVETATGSGGSTVYAWFFYGVRRANAIDKLKWGNNLPTTPDEDATIAAILERAKSNQIEARVKAGII